MHLRSAAVLPADRKGSYFLLSSGKVQTLPHLSYTGGYRIPLNFLHYFHSPQRIHLHYTGKYAIIALQHEAALSRQKEEVLLPLPLLAQVHAVIRLLLPKFTDQEDQNDQCCNF